MNTTRLECVSPRSPIRSLFPALAALALLSSTTAAQSFAAHHGMVDPLAEGWYGFGPANGVYLGPEQLSGGWSVNDLLNTPDSYYFYEQVVSAPTQVLLGQMNTDGWVLSVVLRDYTPEESYAYGSTPVPYCPNASRCVSFASGGRTFTLTFGPDMVLLQDAIGTCGSWSQPLPVNMWPMGTLIPSGPYAAADFGNGQVSHRFDLVFSPASQSAALYVDGAATAALTGYAGHNLPLAHTGPGILFGSMSPATDGSAAYALVEVRKRQTRIYVDANATGANTGKDWANAYTSLRDALSDAATAAPHTGKSIREIWVADGSYRPDVGAGVALNDVNATFSVPSGVKVYGGFAGGETSLSQRDFQANLTHLTGEIGSSSTDSDNSRHVVSLVSSSSATLLDGFIIERGYGRSSSWDNGGGAVFASYSAATVRNCILRDNRGSSIGGAALVNVPFGFCFEDCTFVDNTTWLSGGDGGAIYYRGYNLASTQSATVDRCVFQNCRAEDGGAIYQPGFWNLATFTLRDSEFSNCVAQNASTSWAGGGGAVWISPSTGALVERCTFTANSSPKGGAGIFSNSTLRDCEFAQNVASAEGGAVYSNSTNVFERCTFTANTGYDGGAMAAWGNKTITDCEFVGNHAGRDGGAIWSSTVSGTQSTIQQSLVRQNTAARYGGGVYSNTANISTASTTFRQCTIAVNSAQQGGDAYLTNGQRHTFANTLAFAGTPNSVYANVNPGSKVVLNSLFGVDPLFRDLPGGDLRLSIGSPAIDAGSNSQAGSSTTDLLGQARFVDDCACPDTGAGSGPIVDIGAYESQGGNLGQAYGTGKTNSLGCVPAIELQGACSASAGSGFVLRTRDLLNNQSALVIYSTSGPSSVPLGGGTLWVAAPRKRTPLTNTGGSATGNDCSGEVAFDFNAWISGGNDAALVPGQQVWAQVYSRDSGFSGAAAISLSGAATFVVCP